MEGDDITVSLGDAVQLKESVIGRGSRLLDAPPLRAAGY